MSDVVQIVVPSLEVQVVAALQPELSVIVGHGGASTSTGNSPVSTVDNRGMGALTTTADGDLACAVGLAHTPAGAVTVLVDGVKQRLGVDCYFTAAASSTPRALGDAVIGDVLRWRGSVAGFELSSGDSLDFLYEV